MVERGAKKLEVRANGSVARIFREFMAGRLNRSGSALTHESVERWKIDRLLIEELKAIADRTAGKGNAELVTACAQGVMAAFAAIDAERNRPASPFPATGTGRTPH